MEIKNDTPLGKALALYEEGYDRIKWLIRKEERIAEDRYV